MTPQRSRVMPLICTLVALSVPTHAQDCSTVAQEVSLVAAASTTAEMTPSAPPARQEILVEGNAQHATTRNFQVTSQNAHHAADQIAAECERKRADLQQRWLGKGGADWGAKCEVVVHSDEFAYLKHVGWQAAMTRGRCKIDREHSRIVSRRMDLMADPQSKELTALAHELTHLVLADRFPVRQPPRWADEGIALLADDSQKKSLHLRDLHRALDDRCCPGVREIFAMRQYPHGPRLLAFYGQSLSLIDYLTELAEPEKVVEMVALAMETGYDSALQQIYGIDSTAELERRWRHRLSDNQPQLVGYAR